MNVSTPAKAQGGGPRQALANRRNAVRPGCAIDGETDIRALQDDGHASSGDVETIPALPIAGVLFRALNEAGLRYGIVQDIASLPHAFAGLDDLDILLDKQDYPAFCSIVNGLQGRRGVSLSCYDNVCPGREDWFLPDFSQGRYLHLDMHIGIRVGKEFRKRYPAFDYAAISRWGSTHVDGETIPVVSPEDELRLTIARFAFRRGTLSGSRWITLHGQWRETFAQLPSPPGESGMHVVEFAFGGEDRPRCRVRQSGHDLVIHGDDLVRLRHSIRGMCGFTEGGAFADAAVHVARKTSYLGLRFLQRLLPGRLSPKRRPAAGGLVVAIVGPDGLGKSTQVDRLTQIFRWKFGCAQAYAGTGDGSGWWLRKAVQKVLFPHRRRLKSMTRSDGADSVGGTRAKRGIVATGLALWAILIAFERYTVVKRAHRMATRGLIVICDRWPQSEREGYLDGPSIPPHLSSVRGLSVLASIEQRLFRKMEACRPQLTLHLVSDFAVAESRKPGDIRKEAFDARLSLMAELRAKDKEIRTVDASASVETVGRELFRHIWMSL
jgi:thymidylate kinase